MDVWGNSTARSRGLEEAGPADGWASTRAVVVVAWMIVVVLV
jgi:hypothetical protein